MRNGPITVFDGPESDLVDCRYYFVKDEYVDTGEVGKLHRGQYLEGHAQVSCEDVGVVEPVGVYVDVDVSF